MNRLINTPSNHVFSALWILGMALSTPLVAEEADPVAHLKSLLEANHVTSLDPKQEYSKEKLELGQALFFDPLIGGNRDVSCATCHHPLTATADGRSRSVGTRAYVDKGRRMPEGLRLVDVEGRGPVLMGFNLSSAAHPFTPRNAPEVFNRGDSEWHSMFWDSRCYQREDGKFVVNQARLTKTENYYQVVMPDIVENVLAAQAMMPVLSNAEMRGTKGEMDAAGVHNEVGEVLGQNEEEIWAALVQRLMKIEAYQTMFKAAYPDLAQDKIHFAHAANAIAAFEIDAFSFYDSPFDRFLAGEDSALNESQLRGALLFYGKANCVSCHTGKLQTDQKHYNMGVIPIGPGPNSHEDYDLGIMLRSDYGLEDRFKFRTPPLRNVELTAPYMHNGAYTSLEAAVRHQLSPGSELDNYDAGQLEPEFRGAVHDSNEVIKLVKKTMDPAHKLPTFYSDGEVSDLVEFMKSLTSPSARNLESTIPESVPSGLPMVLPFPATD